MTRWNDAFRASFELLSQAPALRQGQELGQTEIQPPVPAARRAAYQEMKRGSEEGDEAKEAKKPKEDDKAPAPAPAPVKEDEPPVCNVGNLLEICDQDVDFAVELVGEGGQEMTGHAAKAVQQASAMEGGWLTTVRKSTPLQFGVSRGRSGVLLSGYGRVYSRRSCPSLSRKHGRGAENSLVDLHTGSRPSRRMPTVLKVLRGIWAWSGCGRMLLPPNRGRARLLRKWIGSLKMAL